MRKQPLREKCANNYCDRRVYNKRLCIEHYRLKTKARENKFKSKLERKGLS